MKLLTISGHAWKGFKSTSAKHSTVKWGIISDIIDKNLIKNDTIEYVIQVNGKKRATIKFMKDVKQEKLLTEILQNEKTKKIFENKKIEKYFFVKNRLINVLI